MTTDEIWDYLQNHNYFVHHRLYNKFEVTKPSYVEEGEITGKVVLDYGCGYGRNIAWFTKYASKCIGVEINLKIIKEAKKFLEQHGNMKKTLLYLSNNYAQHLVSLDYVFCRFVFQHITKAQTQEVMNNINKYLKIYGKVNLQFRLGTKVQIEKMKEPIVEYTLEEISKLLENIEIENMYVQNSNNVYIIGTKLL